MNKGLIISFSGLDGSGKTTQMKLLMDRLRELNYPIKYNYVRFACTKRINKIKSVLEKNNDESYSIANAQAENDDDLKKDSIFRRLYLYIAYLDLILEYLIIRFHKKQGHVVICDRYYWDCYVIFQYKEIFKPIDKYIWSHIKRIALEPDIPLYFKISAEDAYQRIMDREDDFESLSRLKKRIELYEKVELTVNWEIIDATKPIEEIQNRIWNEVQEVISN
jgi:dTMP kinase